MNDDQRVELDRVRSDRAALVRALQDAGAHLDGDKVRCPFHDDAHASGGIHETDGAWFYTCHGCGWNGAKRSGDVVAVVRRARGLDFASALTALGVGGNGHAAGRAARPCHATASGGASGRPERATGQETASDAKSDPAALAAESAARLQADPAALAGLWGARAIDTDTARRFDLGIDATGRYWTFPVAGGVKHHRIDTTGDGSKCYWLPRGATSGHVWPISIDGPGPVWLCPGELKALAIIAAGRPAVAMTCGETADLPDGLADLLRGRPVAVAADDDDAGRKWARKALDTLTAAGLDVRAVDVGLDKAAGLKDIGDLIVSRVQDGKAPDEIAAELDAAYERADPWRAFTIGGI